MRNRIAVGLAFVLGFGIASLRDTVAANKPQQFFIDPEAYGITRLGEWVQHLALSKKHVIEPGPWYRVTMVVRVDTDPSTRPSGRYYHPPLVSDGRFSIDYLEIRGPGEPRY